MGVCVCVFDDDYDKIVDQNIAGVHVTESFTVSRLFCLCLLSSVVHTISLFVGSITWYVSNVSFRYDLIN